MQHLRMYFHMFLYVLNVLYNAYKYILCTKASREATWQHASPMICRDSYVFLRQSGLDLQKGFCIVVVQCSEQNAVDLMDSNQSRSAFKGEI